MDSRLDEFGHPIFITKVRHTKSEEGMVWLGTHVRILQEMLRNAGVWDFRNYDSCKSHWQRFMKERFGYDNAMTWKAWMSEEIIDYIIELHVELWKARLAYDFVFDYNGRSGDERYFDVTFGNEK